MDPREKRIRDEHPDWTDEQVKAELAKLPPEPPPAPSPPDPDRDRAFAEQRRKAEEAERRAKAAEDALAERQRKEAEEAGEFKRLYEEQKAENDKIKAANKAAEDRRLAERAAGDLKFKDTGYAIYLLEQDRVDLADAAAVKTALERIAETRTDLLATGTPPGPSGGPTPPPRPPDKDLTRGDIARMTQAEVAALDPEVLNKALATP